MIPLGGCPISAATIHSVDTVGLLACVGILLLGVVVLSSRAKSPLSLPLGLFCLSLFGWNFAMLAHAATRVPVSPRSASKRSGCGPGSLDDARREAERQYLEHVLARTGGSRSRAARVSGVSRRTFYNLLERHEIG